MAPTCSTPTTANPRPQGRARPGHRPHRGVRPQAWPATEPRGILPTVLHARPWFSSDPRHHRPRHHVEAVDPDLLLRNPHHRADPPPAHGLPPCLLGPEAGHCPAPVLVVRVGLLHSSPLPPSRVKVGRVQEGGSILSPRKPKTSTNSGVRQLSPRDHRRSRGRDHERRPSSRTRWRSEGKG